METLGEVSHLSLDGFGELRGVGGDLVNLHRDGRSGAFLELALNEFLEFELALVFFFRIDVCEPAATKQGIDELLEAHFGGIYGVCVRQVQCGVLVGACRHRVRLLEEVEEVLGSIGGQFCKLEESAVVSLEYKVDEYGCLVGTFHFWVVDARGDCKGTDRFTKKFGDGALEGLDLQFDELDDLSLG